MPAAASKADTDASVNSAAPSLVWSEQDLAGDPHKTADKPERVKRMFGAIAKRYDLNNRVHSFGRDQKWRREAVKESAVRPGEVVLDAACGTGDLTRLFAQTRAQRVVGLDFTPEMLAIANERLSRDKRRQVLAASRIEYVEGDAQDLPFDDATFNVVSIAFGVRNVSAPDKALREFCRVLKPTGRLVVLEFSEPRSPLLKKLNHIYCSRIMPVTATWLSGDTTGAYRYLPRSVEKFRDRLAMVQAIRDAGFSAVTQRPLTFGVCVCYRGVAPMPSKAEPKKPGRMRHPGLR